jgi:ureidoacrylate peracid hydrolase
MTGNPIIRVPARPEPIEVPAAHAALIVVDMQNGYASPGGYRDLSGKDIAPAQRVIANTLRLTQAVRRAGLPVVFLQNGWDPELKSAGGPDSPNWHKSNPLKLMRARPELRGKILTRGTWDYELVEELTPEPGDFVVQKSRYSGFCGTELDNVLRARNTRYLVFAGIASNVCVESTIRDAYHREYFCILVEDATQQSGPSFVQEAVIYSMENFLGWVTSTDEFCAALGGATSASRRTL